MLPTYAGECCVHPTVYLFVYTFLCNVECLLQLWVWLVKGKWRGNGLVGKGLRHLASLRMKSFAWCMHTIMYRQICILIWFNFKVGQRAVKKNHQLAPRVNVQLYSFIFFIFWLRCREREMLKGSRSRSSAAMGGDVFRSGRQSKGRDPMETPKSWCTATDSHSLLDHRPYLKILLE